MTYLHFINTIEYAFEWDAGKNKINILKHGIDFEDIPEMFNHPMLISIDTWTSCEEDRWVGIGSLRKNVVVVIYTEKKEGKIRIISARKATPYETKEYKNQIENQLEDAAKTKGKGH